MALTFTLDQFHQKPMECIRQIPPPPVSASMACGQSWADLTEHGTVIGRIRRPALKEGEMVEVSIAGLRRGRDLRNEILREGGKFAIKCLDRRVAVVEGVKP